MRTIGFGLLFVGLLLGVMAVYGVRSMSAPRVVAAPRVGQTTVVVAARPLGFGEPLTPEALRLQAWPQGAQPQGSFQTIAQLTSGQKRVALGPIAVNEPVLTTRISGPGRRATLSGVIRAGMRATTIRVNDVFGVAGFVLPGDFVDVLVTRGTSGLAEDGVRTDVLLQSVRVLAVDQLANENNKDPVVAKAATIEVSPAQAQKLALAAQVGTLSLALRGTVDPLAQESDATPQTIRTSDLQIGGAPPARKLPAIVRRQTAPRAQPITAGPTIEITHGVQSSRVSVPREQAAS